MFITQIAAYLKLGSVGSEVQPMSEGIASFTCSWSFPAKDITSTGKLGTKRGREEREEGRRREEGGGREEREEGGGRREEREEGGRKEKGGGREEREEGGR